MHNLLPKNQTKESSLFKFRFEKLNKKRNWWIPLWCGLVKDKSSKHRIRMGNAIWLYLYLLIYTERKTGLVRRIIKTIQKETGFSNRTIYRHLNRLAYHQYITIIESRPILLIRIEKWKEFSKQYKTHEINEKTNSFKN